MRAGQVQTRRTTATALTTKVLPRTPRLSPCGQFGNKMGTVLAVSAQCDHRIRRASQYRNWLETVDSKHRCNVFPMPREWQTRRTQNPVPRNGVQVRPSVRKMLSYRPSSARIAPFRLTRDTLAGPGSKGGRCVEPNSDAFPPSAGCTHPATAAVLNSLTPATQGLCDWSDQFALRFRSHPTFALDLRPNNEGRPTVATAAHRADRLTRHETEMRHRQHILPRFIASGRDGIAKQ